MELRRYWEIIYRRKWVLIQAVGVMVGLALLASFLVTPIFGISSQVLISTENLQSSFLSQGPILQLPENLGKFSYVETRNVVDTYIALAKSSSVIGKVTEELDIRDKKGKLIETKNFVITIPRFLKLLIKQKKGVRIKRLKAAEVLEIKGYSTDREEAARIANGVTQSFMAFLSKLHQKEASSARKSIEKRLLEIDEKKRQAEEAEEQFRIRENAIDLHKQADSLLIEHSALETEKETTHRSLQEAYSNLNAIKNTLKNLSESNNNETTIGARTNLETYKNELLSLEMNLAGLLTELTPEHPMINNIKNQIEAVKGAIKNEISKIFAIHLNSYYASKIEKYAKSETDIITFKARLKVLSEQIDKKKKQLNEIPKKSKELTRLNSKTQTLSSIYDSLLNRLEYAKIAESMDISNAVSVQQAVPGIYSRNDIYFPKKGLITVMSLFLGTIFGVFLCFLLEYLDDTIKTSKDVNEKLNQPVLGILPRVKSELLDNNTTANEMDFYSNFWDLRSNLKMATLDKDYKILSVTSTVKGEGKSTITKYLAYTLVESSQKVLLVDLNLRRPYLHKMFNLSNSIGLSNFLKDEKEIKEIILPTAMDGLYLIPTGPMVTNPVKIIDSPNMVGLIQLIREDYDLIILDTTAIEDGSDVAVISSYSDNIIFVVASGYVSEDNLKRAIGIVQKTKTNISGIVLNKT